MALKLVDLFILLVAPSKQGGFRFTLFHALLLSLPVPAFGVMLTKSFSVARWINTLSELKLFQL